MLGPRQSQPLMLPLMQVATQLATQRVMQVATQLVTQRVALVADQPAPTLLLLVVQPRVRLDGRSRQVAPPSCH